MKAVVVVKPGQVEIRDIPAPEPKPDEALVRIEACGLCGTTDRHIVEGHQCHHRSDWYPAVLGHESVGIVEKVGAAVKKFKVGDRVTRPLAIWPGTERDGLYSAWGGFAEYGLVRDAGGGEPDYNTVRQHVVPPQLSIEDAVAAISFAEVASWMKKLGDLTGASLAIGGTGFAACVMAQCAKAAGAKIIVAFGRNPKKFPAMMRNGATHTLTLRDELAQDFRKINDGAGADWFLDAAGHQAVFDAGLRLLKTGGQAAIYGAPDGFAYRLPLGALGGADFTVRYLSPTDDTYIAEVCQRLIRKELDASLVRTHVWKGLASITEALKEQAQGDVLKGLVIIS